MIDIKHSYIKTVRVFQLPLHILIQQVELSCHLWKLQELPSPFPSPLVKLCWVGHGSWVILVEHVLNKIDIDPVFYCRRSQTDSERSSDFQLTLYWQAWKNGEEDWRIPTGQCKSRYQKEETVSFSRNSSEYIVFHVLFNVHVHVACLLFYRMQFARFIGLSLKMMITLSGIQGCSSYFQFTSSNCNFLMIIL